MKENSSISLDNKILEINDEIATTKENVRTEKGVTFLSKMILLFQPILFVTSLLLRKIFLDSTPLLPFYTILI